MKSLNNRINKSEIVNPFNQISNTDYNNKELSISSLRINIRKNQNYLLQMHDMAFVASLADSSIILPAPIKFMRVREQKILEDKAFTARQFKENLKAAHKLNSRYNTKNKLFEQIRNLYPDFATNMNTKISNNDYQIYRSTFKKFMQSLSNDLIYNGNTSSSELLLQKQDSISEVVDSIEFTKACEIEDKFIISELDIFFKILEDSSKEVKHIFNKHNISMPNGSKKSLFELAEKAKKDRLKRLDKYTKIFSIYQKLENHPYIKLSVIKDDISR